MFEHYGILLNIIGIMYGMKVWYCWMTWYDIVWGYIRLWLYTFELIFLLKNALRNSMHIIKMHIFLRINSLNLLSSFWE